MKITILGSGSSQGVPVIACSCPVCSSHSLLDKRGRTSILIQKDGFNLVVDTGADFREQMIREKVSHLNAVLFTHPHKDHTAGFDDVRSFNLISKKKLQVYGSKLTLNEIKSQFKYIFLEKKYAGIPDVNLNEVKLEPFSIQPLNIIPIEVMHYKLPVLGFRIDDFVYITDAKTISKVELDKMRKAKLLIINTLQIEPHISHLNLEEALKIVEELKPQRTLLTHISHKLGTHQAISQQLPSGVSLAYDGLAINLQ